MRLSANLEILLGEQPNWIWKNSLQKFIEPLFSFRENPTFPKRFPSIHSAREIKKNEFVEKLTTHTHTNPNQYTCKWSHSRDSGQRT